MRLPELKFSGQIMYSRTFDDVQNAITRLLKFLEEKKREMVQIAIGLDVEWRPSFQKGAPPNKVAVMQICGDASHCYVLHLIHSGIPQNLQLLLEDSSVLKVGIGIGEDAAKVFRDYNISIKGVEDLSFHANQKLGRGPHQWGLGSLTEKVLSKQVKNYVERIFTKLFIFAAEKAQRIRLGNWESFLLSRGQLEYAATDAYASWYLYQAIKNLPEAQEVTDSSGQVDGVPQQ
ncbi:Ribonuclease H-like superfamily [Sesbania bispinosa]|nr:Ribonuclease H-like superfamily [Sesbania bispinosa]